MTDRRRRVVLTLCILGEGCGGGGGAAFDAAGTAAGALDRSFSGDGKVTTDAAGRPDRGRAVLIQPGGEILVAGKSNEDYLVIRYLSDGRLDPAFDADGIVSTDIGASSDEGKSLAIQPDGKIILAGISTVAGNGRFSVARYRPDGRLDPTFSTDGVTAAGFGTSNDEGKSVVLQPDGMIVVAGQGGNGVNRDFALMRFDGAGVLDPTFDGDGKVLTDLGNVDNEGNSVRRQADGKLVVAGLSGSAGSEDFAVLRYSDTGVPDPTFDGDGIVTTPIGGGSDIGFAAALQADGRIVVVGITAVGAGFDCALVRYTATGALDPTFGPGGVVTTSIGVSDECTAVAIQADGKIVVAGTTDDGTGTDFAVLRYLADGTPDPSFGVAGVVITAFGSGDDGAFALALQDDGKIVVAGESQGTDQDFAVARYHP